MRAVPGRRPVRPIRCRNDETAPGASIWITRSRSPTSMPSSRALVATMTQSRPSANARSACRRSSRPSELCETNVVDPRRPQLGGELLDPRPAVAEDQPLLAPVQARRSPWRRCRGGRRSRAGPRAPARGTAGRADDPPGPVGAGREPGEQVVLVAHGGRQADPLEVAARQPADPLQAGPAGASRGRRRRRRGPRPPRRPARRRRGGRGGSRPRRASPPATRASSAGSRAGPPGSASWPRPGTSPCQTAARRPTRP